MTSLPTIYNLSSALRRTVAPSTLEQVYLLLVYLADFRQRFIGQPRTDDLTWWIFSWRKD